jgi:hypothetical protein
MADAGVISCGIWRTGRTAADGAGTDSEPSGTVDWMGSEVTTETEG